MTRDVAVCARCKCELESLDKFLPSAPAGITTARLDAIEDSFRGRTAYDGSYVQSVLMLIDEVRAHRKRHATCVRCGKTAYVYPNGYVDALCRECLTEFAEPVEEGELP